MPYSRYIHLYQLSRGAPTPCASPLDQPLQSQIRFASWSDPGIYKLVLPRSNPEICFRSATNTQKLLIDIQSTEPNYSYSYLTLPNVCSTDTQPQHKIFCSANLLLLLWNICCFRHSLCKCQGQMKTGARVSHITDTIKKTSQKIQWLGHQAGSQRTNFNLSPTNCAR